MRYDDEDSRYCIRAADMTGMPGYGKKGFPMTEKLYEQDAYLREFDAAVSAFGKDKDRSFVVLTRSAFYPEGGGQPGDRGALFFEGEDGGLRRAAVLDTHEKDGEIIHYTDTLIPPGTHVHGEIDWAFRFDQMQNHSGEHIVSGLVHEAYGYNNVGFHMGSERITIDFDGMLDAAQLRGIEQKANAIVWQDVETQIRICTQEEAAELTYRSKKELTGLVRIVSFPGADTCACCGTHVRRTGEIGLIRLISAEKFRGGVRVELLCGRRALAYLEEMEEQNHRISVLLSAKPGETAAAVERLKESAAADAYRLVEMENEKFRQMAQDLSGKGDVLLIPEGLGPDQVRRVCAEVMETCGGMCAVFSGSDDTDYKYVIGHKGGDVRALVKRMNEALSGRGGGKPFFVQGRVQTTKTAIEGFFAEELK